MSFRCRLILQCAEWKLDSTRFQSCKAYEPIVAHGNYGSATAEPPVPQAYSDRLTRFSNSATNIARMSTPGCFASLFRSKRPEPKSTPKAPLYTPPKHTTYPKYLAPEVCCSDPHDTPVTHDHLPPYSGVSPFKSDAHRTALEEIEKHADELKQLSIYVHDNPELGYEEFKAYKKITAYLKEHNFEIEDHPGDLETAWKVRYKHGKGGMVFGLNSEFDALPGIGVLVVGCLGIPTDVQGMLVDTT